MKTQYNKIFLCFFILSLLFVLYITVLCRQSVPFRKIEVHPFASYTDFFNGRKSAKNQILLNILLFIPFGFLFPSREIRLHNKIIMSLIFGFIFSLFIESTQYITKTGEFEIDDLINNSIGAIIGAIIRYLVNLFFLRKRIIYLTSILCVTAMTIFCFNYSPGSKEEHLERLFAFQIDDISSTTTHTIVKGFCFPYTQPKIKGLCISLYDPETNKFYEMKTENGLLRNDISEYYGTKDNKFGFISCIENTYIDTNKKYEIYVLWPNIAPLKTDYILDLKCLNINEAISFDSNSLYNNIISNGYLRFYSKENSLYVYQYYNSLYLFAGENFKFDMNNKTYIEYQLWTNCVMKLPQYRINNGWDWDNKGQYFEDCELREENGYRIAKLDIPHEYPVTAIQIGFANKSEWIWCSTFRPILFKEYSLFKEDY